jgi:allantoate deiminase
VAIAEKMATRAQEVVNRCRKLAGLSESADGTTRTFLSPSMRQCHEEISNWLKALGAEVRVDAGGNLRGFYAGQTVDAPRLLIGSHLDTVPNAGAFDGVLGVVLAVALLEELDGRCFPFGIEVVGFAEEEGVRFGTPFIGSRALVGRVDHELLERVDANGISVRGAIEAFGLDPSKLADAVLRDDVLGYLEFHIEQGPVLESLELPLGVVEAIAGQARMEFTFSGRSNHAGTTPMNLRHDAVVAAAEWVLAVEQTAKSVQGLVATIGRIEAKPGATNVIAGEARLSLDVRHKSDEILASAANSLIQQAQQIATSRGLLARHTLVLNQKVVAMDSFLVNEMEQAVQETGCKPYRMTSGAGHDAMILAEKVPAAMLFLRTPGGISHDPAETVQTEDVAKAVECGLHLLDQLANSREFLKGTARA